MPQETKDLAYFTFKISSDFEFCRKPKMVQIILNYLYTKFVSTH